MKHYVSTWSLGHFISPCIRTEIVIAVIVCHSQGVSVIFLKIVIYIVFIY
jgi:hypothetical protein